MGQLLNPWQSTKYWKDNHLSICCPGIEETPLRGLKDALKKASREDGIELKVFHSLLRAILFQVFFWQRQSDRALQD